MFVMNLLAEIPEGGWWQQPLIPVGLVLGVAVILELLTVALVYRRCRRVAWFPVALVVSQAALLAGWAAMHRWLPGVRTVSSWTWFHKVVVPLEASLALVGVFASLVVLRSLARGTAADLDRIAPPPIPRAEWMAMLRPWWPFAVASAAGLGLLAVRIVATRSPAFFFLFWNLLLAWLPVVFALAAVRQATRRGLRSWAFGGAVLAWLLFLPNAPYVITDFVHLVPRRPVASQYWYDLVMLTTVAFTSLLLGLLSLQLLHALVEIRRGVRTGWLFVTGISGLVGVGIWLGRVVRLNSWDVLADPLGVLGSARLFVAAIERDPGTLGFPPLFALMFLLAYGQLRAIAAPRTLWLRTTGRRGGAPAGGGSRAETRTGEKAMVDRVP